MLAKPVSTLNQEVNHGIFYSTMLYVGFDAHNGMVRRRIRMCYWKQWRRCKKRIGELIKLGAPRYHTILTGLSRKGYWHLAKTLFTNCGLGNQYLERQGLTSIRLLWIEIHCPATVR